MKEPFVSIIIVNWNGGEIFEECLKSLSKITYRNYEVIVVDNGSSEKLNIKNSKVKVIYNKKNLGFAPGNNQGVKFSKGKYVLLLNNDTKVTKDFLSVMIQKMESDSSIGIMQPKIKMMDQPEILDNAGSFLTRIGFLDHWGFGKKDSNEYDHEREIFSAKGACLLTRMEIIKKFGLFDDDFVSYFEESDFCWRVWLGGYKVLYYPKTFIYHKVGFTIKRLNVLELNYHYYKNRICSLIKNLSFVNLFLIFIPHIAISNGIAVVFLVRGNFKNFAMIYKSIWWNIVNINNTLNKRSKVQKLRNVSDDYIFERVGKNINWGKFFGDFKRVEKDLA